MILEAVRRIRTQWRATDTVVLCVSSACFGLFIGNCWWQSANVALGISVLGLLVFGAWAVRKRGLLPRALLFGGIVAFLWPVGEWSVVNVFGWWGRYLAPGPKLLETPLYCAFGGWITSAYCYYVGMRALEMGAPQSGAAVASGMSAFLAGVIGENLFVIARMWEYVPSRLDVWLVPAFVPVAYGLSYATVPYLKKLPLIGATLVFSTIMLIVSVGLGLAVGFFPTGVGG